MTLWPQNRLNTGGESARKLSERCFASTRQKSQISYCVKSKIEKSSEKRKPRLKLVWVTQPVKNFSVSTRKNGMEIPRGRWRGERRKMSKKL